MNRWIEMALKIAERSDHSQHKLGAIVLKGGAVISSACNSYKRYRCAETRALQKHYDPDRYKGGTVVVARKNRGCSKPCPRCMEVIRSCGISTIIYLNWNGEIERVRV